MENKSSWNTVLTLTVIGAAVAAGAMFLFPKEAKYQSMQGGG